LRPLSRPDAEPPLSGYVVVELAAGIAGGYCTKLLADGGAEVIKVEPPEGDSLRAWSSSGADIPPGVDGALFSFLACSKQSVVADPEDPDAIDYVHDLLASADAVVWSRGSRLAEHPSLDPAEIHRVHPHLTVTAITPFGLEGPWRDRPATEFTVQAWSGGIVGLGRGAPDRAPVFVGGQIGEWLSGAFGAAATLTARLRALETHVGELVDLSMLETEILCLTYYSVSFLDALGRPWRNERRLMMTGVVSAGDGPVALGIGTAQQWFDLCAMVGHEEWIDETPLSIPEQAKRRAPVFRAWLRSHTVDEIRELATAFRIPNAPVGNGASITEFDHFVQRRMFVTNPSGGFVRPAPPYRLQPGRLRSPTPAPRLGEHTERYRNLARAPRKPATTKGACDRLPFDGLRVLDMTNFWAGPSCTHFLALLGADVIHLESAARPDGTRLSADVPVSEEWWWEKSPIFSGLNTNKKSVTLDIRTERGRRLLHRLASTCDVVVENYTPRILEHIGLEFSALQAIRPDAILVRIPGFGLTGPWRDVPALASVIEGASGLSWLTGHPDQNPLEPYSVGDSNAGIHALIGLLMALEHRRRTGEGVLVEAATVDAGLNVAAEQVIEFSAYGALLERAGNRGPTAAPQNLYQTNEIDEFGRADSWIAVAVAEDKQWAALREALGEPGWAKDPVLDSFDGRMARHDFIDAQLALWCRQRTSDEIVECLWGAGVPVAKVMWPHRLAELPQLQFRDFYEEVRHPISNPARHSTVPMRLSHGPRRFHLQHAPLLGEHTGEVLAELGLTEGEIATLEAEGVIGRSPAAHGTKNRD
jgi:crotonobetainyl-CoA:carnitine CoA-transferase CaiB-like acyl-CoA transferase